jgi:hypothetical protein
MRNGTRSCTISFSSLSLLCLITVGISGCHTALAPEGFTPPASAATTFRGSVFGGQQPISGATIQLYLAGTPTSGGGYGQGAQGLITGTLPTTNANGQFEITGYFANPTTAGHFYIVATGGSPGYGNPVNPNIVLMSAIGGCTPADQLSPTIYIYINEVTTVAAASALHQFIAAPSGTIGQPLIGAPSSATNALQNGFEAVNNLVTSGGGVTHANDWAAVDSNVPLLNTLADIVAYCVNSDPATSANCGSLFSYARPSSSVPAPFDTFQAAWYILGNPTNNVGSLFDLVPASPPFAALSSSPATFAVASVATGITGCQSSVTLATAANFDILGFSTVTNAGPTIVGGGDLGLSPGTSVTGFPPGTVTLPATIHIADSAAAQAQIDLTAAYNYATGLSGGAALPADISGLTLPPGLYTASNTALGIASGTLTLDAQGDSDAVFLFQVGSALTTGSGTQVVLANGAQAKNVFWAVGSSATLGTGSTFQGTIMAEASIALTTNVTIQGRALASTGAVTLDTNSVTAP